MKHCIISYRPGSQKYHSAQDLFNTTLPLTGAPSARDIPMKRSHPADRVDRQAITTTLPLIGAPHHEQSQQKHKVSRKGNTWGAAASAVAAAAGECNTGADE